MGVARRRREGVRAWQARGRAPQARLALSAQLPQPALGGSGGSGGHPALQRRPPGGQVQGRVVGGVVRLCPRALLQQQGDHARVPARRRQVQWRAPVCGGGAGGRRPVLRPGPHARGQHCMARHARACCSTRPRPAQQPRQQQALPAPGASGSTSAPRLSRKRTPGSRPAAAAKCSGPRPCLSFASIAAPISITASTCVSTQIDRGASLHAYVRASGLAGGRARARAVAGALQGGLAGEPAARHPAGCLTSAR